MKYDVAYIKLRKGKIVKSKEIDDRIILDLDRKGKVVGIEVLEPIQITKA